MNVTLELNPIEEAWLNFQTQKQGLSSAEIIRQLVEERISTGNWTPEDQLPALDSESRAAITLLNTYLETEAVNDLEDIRKAEEELAEFKRSMNANRVATGERLVYP